MRLRDVKKTDGKGIQSKQYMEPVHVGIFGRLISAVYAVYTGSLVVVLAQSPLRFRPIKDSTRLPHPLTQPSFPLHRRFVYNVLARL